MHTTSFLVTGAAGGIGRALCRGLLERGHAVTATDLDGPRLAEAQQALAAGNRSRLLVSALDVTDLAQFRRVVAEAIATFGPLGGLINNAGIMSSAPFAEVDTALWQRVIDVNLLGVVHGCRAAVEVMVPQGHGHIVNVASTAGIAPVLNAAPYVATKHAVVGLTNTLREELRGANVHVHLAVPGLIDTGIFDRSLDRGGLSSRAMAEHAPIAKLSPARAAAAIIRGIERNRSQITFPLVNRVLVGAYRWFPRLTTRAIITSQRGH